MNRYSAAALLLLSSSLSAQTTLTLQPDASAGKDALLHGLSSEANNNWGTVNQMALSAWTFGGSPGVLRSVLDFDLSSIPASATVLDATLHLYAWDATDGLGQHSELSGSNAAWLRRITSDWTETGVTWNNQPVSTTVNQVELPGTSDPTQDFVLDVTAMVQDMVDDPFGSHGFLLRLQDENYYRRMNFCSSDHVNSALRPKLIVTYQESLVMDSCYSVRTSDGLGKDALLHGLSSEADNNWGDVDQLAASAWTFAGEPGVLRSVLDFDLTAVPAGATVTGATLSLHAWDATDGLGQHSELSGSNACWLRRVTEDWSEGTVTWNTQPATTTLNEVLIAGTSNPDQDFTLDVTDLVQDMVDEPLNSHGFLLRLDNEEYYRRMNFCSGEHINPALHPALEVCYTTNIGIHEQGSGDDALAIYPNPAVDRARIIIGAHSGQPVTVIICEPTGKIVRRLTTRATEVVMDVSGLPAGWYAVRTLGGTSRTGRFLVTR